MKIASSPVSTGSQRLSSSTLGPMLRGARPSGHAVVGSDAARMRQNKADLSFSGQHVVAIVGCWSLTLKVLLCECLKRAAGVGSKLATALGVPCSLLCCMTCHGHSCIYCVVQVSQEPARQVFEDLNGNVNKCRDRFPWKAASHHQ